MAHNLNYNDSLGRHSFFSVKEKAWHGLGAIVKDYPTSAEAIRLAGLDFTVAKDRHKQEFPSGRTKKANNSFFTFRTDTEQVLGENLTKDYHIVQNAEAFAFFDSIVGSGEGIKYETAGALGDGERIFITAKLADYIRVGHSNDVIEKYLFLTTSHNGQSGIRAAFTPTRIVCQNTLNAAMANCEMSVSFNHTADVHLRLKQLAKVMNLVDSRTNDLQELFTGWSKIKITDEHVLKLVQMAMAPDNETMSMLEKGLYKETSTRYRNTVDKVYEYAMSSETQQMETTKGTVFGAYNAVTGYYQNVCGFKTNESKVKSIVYGGLAQQRTQKAFDLCTGYVKDGADIFQFN
ncbi:DUF932 domain-containing protein [Chitinophaga defluvii]|uniref:DUF932 domain-containing protein n=1 Tax=Chitinophaga defluvii TaxID=3163343 RepID=A0ABV2TEZ1_9BACT